jgi:hypothetical protein
MLPLSLATSRVDLPPPIASPIPAKMRRTNSTMSGKRDERSQRLLRKRDERTHACRRRRARKPLESPTYMKALEHNGTIEPALGAGARATFEDGRARLAW